MSKEKKKIDPIVILLDMIIVIMVFVIILVGYQVYFYVSLTNEASSFMQDSNMMSFELQNNDYASMIRGKYINELNGDKKAKSYHALAEYTEAASKYKVYEDKGYTDEAAAQKSIMDDNRKAMGNLTVFADRVDRMLGFNN